MWWRRLGALPLSTPLPPPTLSHHVREHEAKVSADEVLGARKARLKDKEQDGKDAHVDGEKGLGRIQIGPDRGRPVE